MKPTSPTLTSKPGQVTPRRLTSPRAENGDQDPSNDAETNRDDVVFDVKPEAANGQTSLANCIEVRGNSAGLSNLPNVFQLLEQLDDARIQQKRRRACGRGARSHHVRGRFRVTYFSSASSLASSSRSSADSVPRSSRGNAICSTSVPCEYASMIAGWI